MNLKRLSKQFYTTDQLQPGDISALAECGIRSVINNRPDGEADDQPMGSAIEYAVKRRGLEYIAVPIKSKIATPEELRAFKCAVSALPKPICGFCRTGTRAMVCWALSEVGERSTDSILESVVEAGFPSDDVELQIVSTTTQSKELNNVS